MILGFFLVDTAAMVFGMPLALFPALAARFGNPPLVGYLYSAPAAGALVAGLASAWIAHVRRRGVGGLADQASAIFGNAMLLALTPDRLLGRVRGIEFMQVASAPSLGNLEAGVVVSLTRIRVSVASGGLLCVAGTIASAAAFPALIRYEAGRRAAGS